MNKPLIRTKLHIPPPFSNQIFREQLIKRFNEENGGKITLVSAPPGYGKTTLLISWLNQLDFPKAWLSLDNKDNDPVLFFSYLISAFQQVQPGFGEGLINSFQIPQPIDFEPFLVEFVNKLLNLPDKTTLVLEDYHHLEEPIIHQAVTFIIDHQPQNLHLIIATRSDPPLPLSRLRATGQLSEIRMEDLKFTFNEAEFLVKNLVGDEIELEDIEALFNRTEGWVTGLKLAALSLRRASSKKTIIKDIGGNDTFIADFLTGEVLKNLPADLYSFLLITSILDRFSIGLCETLTGMTDSQEKIKILQEENLFVVPLDNQQNWFRYHILFIDFLRARLVKLYPEMISTLHIRASKWFESHGYLDEAIEHLMKAGEFDLAAALMERSANSVLLEGRTVTFLNWVELLPEEIRQTYLILSTFYVFLLFLKGTPSTVIQTLVDDIEKKDTQKNVIGEIALLRSYIGLDREQSRTHFENAMEWIPSDRTYFKAFATFYFAAIQMLRGDFEIATRYFTEAVHTSQRTGKKLMMVLGLCRLGEISMCQAQLHQAEAYFSQALACIQEQNQGLQSLSGDPLIGLGRVAYEKNEFEKSKSLIKNGIEIASALGETKTMIGHITLANMELFEGKIDLAHKSMLNAQIISEKATNSEVYLPVYFSSRIQFELRTGDRENARQILSELGLINLLSSLQLKNDIQTHPFPFLRIQEAVSLAFLSMEEGQFRKAITQLEPLLKIAMASGWKRESLSIYLKLALSHRSLGNESQSLSYIEKALELAEPENFIHLFIEHGRPMFELLHHALRHKIAPVFTKSLLSEFRRMQRSSDIFVTSSDAQSLVDPLTPREINVLQLLRNGLSNKKIAEKLIISPGTVKKHLDNIYAKLGVHNRTEAITRAHEENLIQ